MWVSIVAVYLACFLWIGHYGAFWSEDAGVKYLQVASMVRSCWTDATIAYPGRRIDPFLEFNPLRGTHTYVRDGTIRSIYPLAFPWISSLAYARLGSPGLYLLPFVSTLLMIALVQITGMRISGRRNAAVMTLVAAFACPTFFYAFAFWEMNVAAAFLMAGVLLAFSAASSPRRPACTGILMGAAALFREESVLFIAASAIILGVCRRDLRAGIALLLGAAVTGAGHLVADRLAGGPGIAHLMHNIVVRTREFGSAAAFIRYKLALSRELLFSGSPNAWFNLLLLAPWAGYLIALGAMFRSGRAGRGCASRERVLLALLSLILVSHCAYLALGTLSAYPVRLTPATSGLLMFSPWVAFATASCARGWRRASAGAEAAGMEDRSPPLARELAMLAALCIALICVFVPTSGGLQWGPRYLVIVYPLLAVVSCASFDAWRERSRHRTWLVALFVLFMLLGAANELRGIGFLKRKKEFNARAMECVRRYRADAVIALPWWVPLNMAPIYYGEEFFSARDPLDLDRLIGVLRGHGRKRFILITEDDPTIVIVMRERYGLAPADVQRVRMRGDDYFKLIVLGYTFE